MAAHENLAPAPSMPAEDLYPSRVGTRPSILRRRDPVVHGVADPAGGLDATQLQQFERDGYLVLRDLFSQAEIDRLRAEVARLRDAQSGIDGELLVLEPGSSALRSVFAVHRISRTLAKLFADPRLLGAVRTLLGDEPYIHQSRLNCKPGFDGAGFDWHSDFETWHVEDGMPRMRAVSVSIALSPNDEFNGPLMVVPGSHRSFVVCTGHTPPEHYRSSLREQELGVPDRGSLATLMAEGGITSVKGPPGTVTIFDCNLIHGSAPNMTPQGRENVFIVYNAMCNRLVAPYCGLPPRPEHIAARAHVVPVVQAPS